MYFNVYAMSYINDVVKSEVFPHVVNKWNITSFCLSEKVSFTAQWYNVICLLGADCLISWPLGQEWPE